MIKLIPPSIRSPEENAYYHGVVVRSIADFKGWSVQRAHQWVKETFGQFENQSRYVVGIVSTASLYTIEFEGKMDDIRKHVLKYWKLEIKLPIKKLNLDNHEEDQFSIY